MARNEVIENLYQQLNSLIRRSRELSNELHPDLSLMAHTFLSLVESTPELRASDLTDRLGLDKSTVVDTGSAGTAGAGPCAANGKAQFEMAVAFDAAPASSDSATAIAEEPEEAEAASEPEGEGEGSEGESSSESSEPEGESSSTQSAAAPTTGAAG